MSLLSFLANPLGGGKLRLLSQESAIDRELVFPDEDGNLIGYAPQRIWLSGSPGKGSINTGVVRFSVTEENVGSDVTYADSATLGASFTVNKTGLYAVEFGTGWVSGAIYLALSKNAAGADLTATDPSTIALPKRLGLMLSQIANTGVRLTVISRLIAGDVVRAHVSSGGAPISGITDFRITRIG